MKKNSLKIFFLLFQIFIFSFLWIFWSTDLSSYSLSRKKSLNEVPDYYLDKLRYFNIQSSKVTLDLHGDRGRMSFQGDTIEIDGVNGDIFQSQGGITKLSSRSASIKLGERKMYLKEDVHLEMENDISAKSNSLLYDFNSKIISTSDGISIFSKESDMNIQAQSMKVPMEEGKGIQLEDSVHVSYIPSSGAKVHVKGNKALLFRKKNKIWMGSEVELEQDKLRLNSEELFLYYNRKTESNRSAKKKKEQVLDFNYLMARGKVEIRDLEDRLSKSEKAEFFASKDIIVLTGSPVVHNGSNILTGDRLILHRKKKMVELESANAVLGDPERATGSPGFLEKENSGVENIELDLGE